MVKEKQESTCSFISGTVWVVHVNFFVEGDTKTRAHTKNTHRHKGVISSLISCQVACPFQRTRRVFMKETKDKDRLKNPLVHMSSWTRSSQKRPWLFSYLLSCRLGSADTACNLFKCSKPVSCTSFCIHCVQRNLQCNSERCITVFATSRLSGSFKWQGTLPWILNVQNTSG